MMTNAAQTVDDFAAYFTSADETACETKAIGLGEQGQSGLSTLKQLLEADDADVRFWTVRGLWANGSAGAIELLITALQDTDEMIRSGSALALGEMKAAAAIERLADLLEHDPSGCGNHAADALSKMGHAATPALVNALQNDKPWVRVRAAKALISLEDRVSIGPLFHALEDDSYMVRHYAELALERMGVGQMVYFS